MLKLWLHVESSDSTGEFVEDEVEPLELGVLEEADDLEALTEQLLCVCEAFRQGNCPTSEVRPHRLKAELRDEAS